jgi:hypothetical protein
MQLIDGFAWACEFGKTEIVEFLLDHGVDLAVRVPHHGQTGLHWAALGGHLDAVKLLLDRGAPVDVVENDWGGTPLSWALHGWIQSSPGPKRERYYGVVQALVLAGAKVKPEWLTQKTILSDQRIQEALAGH